MIIRKIWKLFWWLVSLSILLALCMVIYPCVSHGTPTNEPLNHSLRIITYNTHRMGEFKKVPDNHVIQYLLQQEADIICLQEVEVYHNTQYLTLDELREAFKVYPYTYFDFSVYNSKRQFGNVVFSRYPLINKQTVRYSSRANISSRCDIVIDSDTLRLITNHLESNRIEPKDWIWSEDENNLDMSSTAQNIQQKYESAKNLREEQARKVHDEVKASPYPVIVVGDINDIPLSKTYRILSNGLTDSFLATSWWNLGTTYVWHHIGLRIDYVLISKTLHPIECKIDEVHYSDHYPLQVLIRW